MFDTLRYAIEIILIHSHSPLRFLFYILFVNA